MTKNKNQVTKQKKAWPLSKKTTIILCAVVAIAVGLTVILLTAPDNIAKALNGNAKVYDNVTITITTTTIDLELIKSSGTEATESTDATEETELPTSTQVTTILKNGDSYYETDDYSQSYFYYKDGKRYVRYYDDMLGMGDGQWIEETVEDANLTPSFDFSVLNSIQVDTLEEADGRYIPLDMDEVFFAIKDTEFRSYYANRFVSFRFDGEKLTEIRVHYIFDDKYQVSEVYSFTYGDALMTMPALDGTNGQ